MRQSFKILGIVVCVLLSVSVTFSQDADSDAMDTVIGAFETLADGYTYTQEVTISQQFIDEDSRYDSVANQLIEGEVDENENFYVRFELRGGETLESIADSPIFTMQQLSLDEMRYVDFGNIADAYPTVFSDIEGGWQVLDELLATFHEDSTEILIMNSLTNITLLSDLPLTDSLILSIEEQDAELVDGQSMRVFVAEIDAQRAFLMQLTGDFEEQLTMMLEFAGVFAKSEYELHYTLWIGADDGLLYAGGSEGYTHIPYLTEQVDGPPYDITTGYSSTFTISAHGQTEVIQLPDELD